MDTDPRTIALVIARGRVVFGLLSARRSRSRRQGSCSVRARRYSRALLRMVGVRDVALGVGAITSLKEETQDAEWVAMGALADAGDALAMWLAPDRLAPLRQRALRQGAAIVGILCARQLADQRAASPNSRTRVAAVQKSMPESSGIHLPRALHGFAPPVAVEGAVGSTRARGIHVVARSSTDS